MCVGTPDHMAKDVHQTLIDIGSGRKAALPPRAADYVNITLMKTEKRYLRDVY